MNKEGPPQARPGRPFFGLCFAFLDMTCRDLGLTMNVIKRPGNGEGLSSTSWRANIAACCVALARVVADRVIHAQDNNGGRL